VTSFVTDLTAANVSMRIPNAILPVDLAVSPDGGHVAIVAAGNGHTQKADALISFAVATLRQGATVLEQNGMAHHVTGQLTSVAFVDASHVVAYVREPPGLVVVSIDDPNEAEARIDLPGEPREDTGHAIFHSDSGHGIACASCHAEGGDDGRVWFFAAQGDRRTPSLRGTTAGTAPYHWAGELPDVPSLVHQVYESRMGGPTLHDDQNDALRSWLFAIPRPPAQPAVDAEGAARGKALFEGEAQCSSCHSGAHLTNNATVDVGTGGAFQVPSLIGVSMRTPLLHDGCAKTLRDRFVVCGTARHGATTGLASSQIDDLVSYLSTL
jgi:cytochrome c peroxidase